MRSVLLPTVVQPANARLVNTETLSQAALVSQTNALHRSLATRLRFASVAVASIVARELFAESEQTVMPVPASVSVSHRLWVTLIYSVCRRPSLPIVIQSVEVTLTVNMDLEAICACVTQALLEIPMKVAAPRRRQSANQTLVEWALNAAKHLIKSTVCVLLASMGTHIFSALILMSVRAWHVDKVPYASTLPEATIAAVSLDTMETRFQCVQRLNWTTAMIQRDAHATLK